MPLSPGAYAPPSATQPSGGYAPPSMPLGYPPYGPQGNPAYLPPPPPRRRGPVIAIVSSILVVIALIVAAGAAIVLSKQSGSATSTPGAKTSYAGTVTPGATATAATGGHVIFQDDFSSSSSGWLNDSHCFYASDGYHIPDGYICYAPTDQLADAVVSADAHQTTGDTGWFYGVVFRRVSKGNYYSMAINSVGDWKFAKHVNGQRTDLLPYVHTAALNTGLNAKNTLTARIVGSHFEFFINGVKVGEYDDSTFTRGSWGVEGAGGTGVEIVYTHFSLALPS